MSERETDMARQSVTVQFGTWAEFGDPETYRTPDRTGPFRPVGPREWLAIERKCARPFRRGPSRPVGIAGGPAARLESGETVAAVLDGRTAAFNSGEWSAESIRAAIERRARADLYAEIQTAATAGDLWRLWYAMESIRPADLESAAYAVWAADAAELHARATAAGARESVA